MMSAWLGSDKCQFGLTRPWVRTILYRFGYRAGVQILRTSRLLCIEINLYIEIGIMKNRYIPEPNSIIPPLHSTVPMRVTYNIIIFTRITNHASPISISLFKQAELITHFSIYEN